MTATRASETSPWSRRNPFPATLLRKVLLSPPGEPRAKYHYELSLEGSGLRYEPGDSLAIFPENDPELVDLLLARLKLVGSERLIGLDGNACTIREVLLRQANITRPSARLREAVADLVPREERDALTNREPLDLLDAAPEFCREITPQGFVNLLPKLQPRLYSLASSMRVHGTVAQLFVSSVEYESGGRLRRGVCTSYLSDRVALLATVPVFIHAAPHFHLPLDANAAVIMIGAGTGVAPFRAFLEERAALRAEGRSWLFFGQLQAATGFYYRADWNNFLRCGVLTQLDTAFLHDTPQGCNVQDRMLERGAELWAWLCDAAHVYLCGDAHTLAPAVDAALEQIAAQHGRLSPGKTAHFVQTLREQKRYHRDVY